jgi:FKBP-type peptidyl-prolyl cis-trans isomerase FkpA
MHIHRATRLTAFVAVVVLLAAACTNPVSADKLPPPDPTQVTYATALGIDLTQFSKTTNGVYYKDDTPGTGGTVVANDSLGVGYTGYLTDGTKFDSNQQAGGTLFRFRISKGSVIKGWDEGIIGMKVGGVRRLIIPSPLAYGRTGSGAIPANAVLVFSVSLISIY